MSWQHFDVTSPRLRPEHTHSGTFRWTNVPKRRLFNGYLGSDIRTSSPRSDTDVSGGKGKMLSHCCAPSREKQPEAGRKPPSRSWEPAHRVSGDAGRREASRRGTALTGTETGAAPADTSWEERGDAEEEERQFYFLLARAAVIVLWLFQCCHLLDTWRTAPQESLLLKCAMQNFL